MIVAIVTVRMRQPAPSRTRVAEGGRSGVGDPTGPPPPAPSRSLIAVAGVGPSMSPRRVRVANLTAGESIKDLPSAASNVLTVLLSMTRLVCVTRDSAQVFELQTLELQTLIKTPANPLGVAAISTGDPEAPLLALPSSEQSGAVAVHPLSDGPVSVSDFPAHRSRLVAMAWTPLGDAIASASEAGTLIRVHDAMGGLLASLRRGSMGARIHCLSFCQGLATGSREQLLCCTTSHNTVHVFRVDLTPQSTRILPSGAATFIEPRTAEGKMMQTDHCRLDGQAGPSGSSDAVDASIDQAGYGRLAKMFSQKLYKGARAGASILGTAIGAVAGGASGVAGVAGMDSAARDGVEALRSAFKCDLPGSAGPSVCTLAAGDAGGAGWGPTGIVVLTVGTACGQLLQWRLSDADNRMAGSLVRRVQLA